MKKSILLVLLTLLTTFSVFAQDVCCYTVTEVTGDVYILNESDENLGVKLQAGKRLFTYWGNKILVQSGASIKISQSIMFPSGRYDVYYDRKLDIKVPCKDTLSSLKKNNEFFSEEVREVLARDYEEQYDPGYIRHKDVEDYYNDWVPINSSTEPVKKPITKKQPVNSNTKQPIKKIK